MPGVECRIAPDGEILTRGPHVMKGYFNKPKETADAIDADGWFHTGDIGVIDEDGFLAITDRKKEILVNSNGKNIAPAPIESFLKGQDFVSLPVVIGDRRKFLSCLIVPNFEKLAAWAEGRTASAAARWRSSSRSRASSRSSRRAIDEWNDGKPHEQLVHRFAVLPKRPHDRERRADADAQGQAAHRRPALQVPDRRDVRGRGRVDRSRIRMRVVVALGGNALLRRGEPMTAENQRANVRRAAEALAPVAREHELVISHGNGPAGRAPRAAGRVRPRRRALPARRPRRADRGDDRLHDRAGARKPPARSRSRSRRSSRWSRSTPRTRHSKRRTSRSAPSTPRRRRSRLAKERGWAVAPGRGGVAAGRRLAAAEADLRDPAREVAPREGDDRDLRGRGRDPDRVRRGREAPRRRVRHRQGPRRVAPRPAARRGLLRHGDRRLGRLRRLGHAVREGDPARLAGRDRTVRLRVRLDGARRSEAARDFAERTGKTAAIGALEDIPRILAGEAGTLVSNDVATIEWAAPESLALFTE